MCVCVFGVCVRVGVRSNSTTITSATHGLYTRHWLQLRTDDNEHRQGELAFGFGGFLRLLAPVGR